MAINPFNIITEFRFDIASAVADSKTLQNQVGLISDTANQALYSLQRVGMGLVTQMGLFSGGLVGFLLSAVQASEKFHQSQLKIANIFQSNRLFTGPNAFEHSMLASEKALERMQKAAEQFSLPAQEMVNMASMMGAVLTVKGLDDSKLTKSIDISRQFLKSAPILGVDPTLSMNNLIDLISGNGSMGNRMTERLVAETEAMKPYGGRGGLQKFNALDPAKRLDILTKSLGQFSSNVKITDAVANSLTGQMQKLGDNLKSIFSIFRKIGDAIKTPLVKALAYLNDWLAEHGKAMSNSLASLIKDFLEDPVKAYQTLRQLGRLQGDTRFAGKIAFIIEMFHIGAVAIAFMQVKMTALYNVIMSGVRWIGALAMRFVALIPFTKVFMFLLSSMVLLLKILARTLLPLIFFMQIFSATLAKIETSWASWMATNAGRMASVFERIGTAMSRVMLPITEAIAGISDMLSAIGSWFVTKEYILTFFEFLADILEWVAEKIVLALSAISGFGAALGQMIYDITNMKFKGMGGRMVDAFGEGAWDYYSKIYKIKDGSDSDLPVSQQVTNIGTVNVNQQFKEQMEPDRIAFAFTEQLKKIAMNPAQASGGNRARAGLVGQ